MSVNFFTQNSLSPFLPISNIAAITTVTTVFIRIRHRNSLYILLLIIYTPLFIFLLAGQVSVQFCIPRCAARNQFRGIFDIIQTGRSFIQVKFIIHIDFTDNDVAGISSLQRYKMINESHESSCEAAEP